MSLNCEPGVSPTPEPAGRFTANSLIWPATGCTGAEICFVVQHRPLPEPRIANCSGRGRGAAAHADARHRPRAARDIGVGDDRAVRAVLRRPPHAGRLARVQERDVARVQADVRPRRALVGAAREHEVRRRLQRAAVRRQHRLLRTGDLRQRGERRGAGQQREERAAKDGRHDERDPTGAPARLSEWRRAPVRSRARASRACGAPRCGRGRRRRAPAGRPPRRRPSAARHPAARR